MSSRPTPYSNGSAPPRPAARDPELNGDGEDDDSEYQPAEDVEITDVDADEDLDYLEEEEEEEDDEDAYVDEHEELQTQDFEATAAQTILELLRGAGADDDDDEDQQMADDGDGPARTYTDEDGQPRIRLTRHELLRLFTQANLAQVVYNDPTDADEETYTSGYGSLRRRPRRTRATGEQFPKVPSDAGRALMESGDFGTNERLEGHFERKKKLAARIMRRELGLESPGKQRSANRLAAQELIPSSNADTIIHYDNRCYSGQFSDDGNFFFTCSQDFCVRMYDTSNPYDWKYYKTVLYPYGQWTITDATLSPDNKFLAYSSIKSNVCLASTDPENDSDPTDLDFANYGANIRRRPRGGYGYGSHFGIWSIRFSGDGRELVSGTSDNSVYVYDLETRKTILRIRGHDDDVNAVCFGDKMSPHLLYSGSDDTMLKVWDRRSMADNREAGVFFGHREGLTFVDSKGDGRYVLSNGKDQTMKLWDLRKMMSTEASQRIDPQRYTSGFDYRFQDYDEEAYEAHPHDCSVVTFRGHKVLKTLIRCHFSPPGSTDNRYVYSGSEDGSVFIYNLDATLAGKVDVTSATRDTRPRGDEDHTMMAYYADDPRRSGAWKTCVRDASWHPHAPVIAATSWNGYGMHQGTCTVHTWTDGLDEDEAEPAMGQRVDAKLQYDHSLYEARPSDRRSALRSTRLRRSTWNDGDDD